jgi:hypothetical protein
MRIKFLPVLLFTVCLVLVSLALWGPPPEPKHKGRVLGDWLADLDTTNHPVQRQRAMIAVREIGTNALPLLLRLLETDRTGLAGTLREMRRFQTVLEFQPSSLFRWRAIYGFRALGPSARVAIPRLTELLYQDSTCTGATFALMAIGPEAVPILEQASLTGSEWVRYQASWGLERLGVKPVPSV